MTKEQLEIPRKLFHMLGYLFVLLAYEQLSYPVFSKYLFSFSVVFISLDICKSYFKKLQKLSVCIFKKVIRDCEHAQLTGISYSLIGLLISTSLFSHQINTLVILFATFVDPISSFFGVLYGKEHKLSANASLHGCIAGFLSAFFLSVSYFFMQNLMLDRLLIVSILASFIATASESLNFKIDDNLVIPVFSSTGLYGIFYLFNI